jgi:hypothetical protein
MKKILILLTLIIVFSHFSDAQRNISGIVVDSLGNPLSDVLVQAKGTTINATTGTDGKYTISVTPYVNVLIFSHLGMKTIELEIKTEVINVIMYSDGYDEPFEAYEVYEVFSITEEPKLVTDDIKKEKKVKGYATTNAFGNVRAIASESSLDYSSKSDVHYESTETEGDRTVTDEVSGGADNIDVKSGLLTAGEINDYGKWKLWQDIAANELKTYKAIWKMMPRERYCVQVINYSDRPVVNAQVYLKNKEGEIIWSASSDNTGKAELWANIYDSTLVTKNLYIEVKSDGQSFKLHNPQKFNDGINFINIPVKCSTPNVANIAFVVDATGSMGDEIAYLKAELEDVLNTIKKNHKDLNINTASVFYRDKGDLFLTQKSDFSEDVKTTVDFIKLQGAGGGGDFPESVDVGLNTAINELKWADNALAKVIFLILDAPPHGDDQSIKNIQDLTKTAAERGIRIVPVTASGIDKSTEYLMRAMALATNGTYVFLTDDSGIGNSHIKPTTDEYQVEFLNDVFIRLIKQYLTIPECEEQVVYNPEEIQDTSFIADQSVNQDSTMSSDTLDIDSVTTDIIVSKDSGKVKYWPNPTVDIVNIEITGEMQEMFLADVSGKILQRFDIKNQTTFTINIGQYPAGIYFLQYQNGERWQTGKIILTNRI